MGRHRSPVWVVTLGLGSLGAYWFAWCHRAFAEVAAREGRRFVGLPWVVALALLWPPVVVLHFLWWAEWARDASILGEITPYAAGIDTQLRPFNIALMLLTAAFFAAQWWYLRRAQALASDAFRGAATVRPPAAYLLPAWSIAMALTGLPGFGGMFGLAGIALAVAWVAWMQGALNAYWQGAAADQPLPAPGWLAQPRTP